MSSPRTATKSSPHSRQLEKFCTQRRRPNAAKKKKNAQDLLAAGEGGRPLSASLGLSFSTWPSGEGYSSPGAVEAARPSGK